MTAVVLAILGILCVLSGVYGFLYPQRLYRIRQISQTHDDPQLSDSGRVLWRIVDVVLVVLGVYVVWYSFGV